VHSFLLDSHPEILFPKRYRGVLGVGTHRPDRNELLHSSAAAVFHQQAAHHEVVVKEAAWGAHVCSDTTDNRRQVDHDVRPMVCVEALDSVLVRQIVLRAPRHEHAITTDPSKCANDSRPEETSPPGHQDGAVSNLHRPQGYQGRHIA